MRVPLTVGPKSADDTTYTLNCVGCRAPSAHVKVSAIEGWEQTLLWLGIYLQLVQKSDEPS